MIAVEVVEFALKEGASEKDLLREFDRTTTLFEYRYKGFIRRELFKSENTYTDLVWWSSRETANEAAQKILNDKEAQGFLELIEKQSVSLKHLDKIA